MPMYFSFVATTDGKLIGGDILIDPNEKSILESKGRTGTKRQLLGWIRKLWRTREIPYEVVHPGTSKKTSCKVLHL